MMGLSSGVIFFQACSPLGPFSIELCGEVYAFAQGDIPSAQEQCVSEGSKHTDDSISASYTPLRVLN